MSAACAYKLLSVDNMAVKTVLLSMHACACLFFSHCLATIVFTGKLPATGWPWV